jgi:hypothetical protein
MTYKVCYWDAVDGCQKERDTTPEETAEINERRSNPQVFTPPTPTKEQLLAQLNALSAQIQALE